MNINIMINHHMDMNINIIMGIHIYKIIVIAIVLQITLL